MNKKDFSAIIGTVLLLACLPIIACRAADSPFNIQCPATLKPQETMDAFNANFEECIRLQQANHEAKVTADKIILAARFKAHPELLKNPKFCDKLLVESHDLSFYTQDSYYMMEACQDITGVTARMKRARAADCASGNPNGACAMGERMMEESKQKLDKDFDDIRRSMDESNRLEQTRIDREYEENTARITRDSLRDMDTDNKIHTLREQFQDEDRQRRIDDAEKSIDEDEEDDRLMDRAIAHDHLQ